MTKRPANAIFAAMVLATSVARAVPAQGQERPEEGTLFTGETTVLAVEVPVQVLLDGEPVRGLTADDFVVYEGRERRPLTGFEVVDLGVEGRSDGDGPAPDASSPSEPSGSGAALSVPAAGRRHFLLLFDLSFTQPGYLSRAIEGARGLVRGGLHPSDLVGVAFYSERRGVTMPLQFTPDRPQVERVLDGFEYLLDGKRPPEADAAAEGVGDPLGLVAGGWSATLAEVGQAAGYQTSDFAEAAGIQPQAQAGGTLGDFLLNNILSHSAAFTEQAIREQRGAQIAYLSDSLEELADRLRAIEGPKHLLLLSQGFDADLLEVEAGNVEVGTGAGGWVLREVNDMIAALRRSGWVIHGADLKGIEHPFEAGGSASFKASLHLLAEETGGVLIENANDLTVGLEEVLERTRVTYVLTFQVEDAAPDGSFHPIRVELAEGPRGARLVHRSGYHAPRPAGERNPFEERATAAARLLAGEEVAGLATRLVATSLAYAEGRARVPVLVEVAEPTLLGGGADGVVAEIYVYAFDETGTVADFFAHTVTAPPTSGEGGEGPLQGVKLAGELDLAPGRYELRALVRSPGTRREAVKTASLEVPAPQGGPRLLPPLFVQGAAERWLVATIGNGGAVDGGSYPFTVEGTRIAPAAAPVLAPGETARLLLPGVGIAADGVDLRTRILNAAGAPVSSGHLEILGRRPPAAGQPDLVVGRLDASGLAPGSYELEVTLAASGQRVRAPFRVGG